MKIVADAHMPFVQSYVGALGDLVLKPGREIGRNDLIDADVLLVRSITRVNEALLHDTAVKFVGSVTAGADHLDSDYLSAAGITWCTAQGFNAPPVADYVVAVIAALQRKRLLNTHPLRAAIIGVGHVGKRVASYFAQLGIDVIRCDPLRADQEPNFHSTPLAAIEEVDIITLHVPLTHRGPYPTHHFIDHAFLQRQKPGCVLINTSRGAVMHAPDALSNAKHLSLCLDVWEHEPHINQALLESAVIATPHIAGYAVQSKMRGIDIITRALIAHQHLSASRVTLPTLPTQQLQFAGAQHHWQDIVLGVFNPLVMTAMMRTQLLGQADADHQFDLMRNQFNYRHELAYTTLSHVHMDETSRAILLGLGVGINDGVTH